MNNNDFEIRVKKCLEMIDKEWTKEDIINVIKCILSKDINNLKIKNPNIIYDKACQEAIFIKINNNKTTIFKI